MRKNIFFVNDDRLNSMYNEIEYSQIPQTLKIVGDKNCVLRHIPGFDEQEIEDYEIILDASPDNVIDKNLFARVVSAGKTYVEWRENGVSVSTNNYFAVNRYDAKTGKSIKDKSRYDTLEKICERVDRYIEENTKTSEEILESNAAYDLIYVLGYLEHCCADNTSAYESVAEKITEILASGLNMKSVMEEAVKQIQANVDEEKI